MESSSGHKMFEKLNLVVLGRWFNVIIITPLHVWDLFLEGWWGWGWGWGFFLVKVWKNDSMPLFFMDCLHQCSTTAMANSQGCSLIL